MNETESVGASPWTSTTRYGRAALESITDEILGASVGERHHVVFTASLKGGSLVGGNEIDPTEAEATLVRAALERGLERSDAERQVSRGIEKGRLNPRSAPKDGRMVSGSVECREIALAWSQAVTESDADPTTKAILLVIGRECIEHGRVETNQSFRQVAELAGVSVSTVHRIAEQVDDWVRVIRAGHGPKTCTKWRLRSRTPKNALVAVPTVDPAENQFHRNKAEWLAFAHLDPAEPTTPEELARIAGRSRRWVANRLRKWVTSGIATVTAAGVVAVAGAGFAVTAVDHRKLRQRRHLADRKDWLERRAKAIAEKAAEKLLPEPVRGALRLLRRSWKYEDRKARRAPVLAPVTPPAFGGYTVPSKGVLPKEVA